MWNTQAFTQKPVEALDTDLECAGFYPNPFEERSKLWIFKEPEHPIWDVLIIETKTTIPPV